MELSLVQIGKVECEVDLIGSQEFYFEYVEEVY